MSKIIQFLFKWILPIGFVGLIINKIPLFTNSFKGSIDELRGTLFYRICDSKTENGAGVLVRKETNETLYKHKITKRR